MAKRHRLRFPPVFATDPDLEFAVGSAPFFDSQLHKAPDTDCVEHLEGVDFGTVSHLFSTGANDVLCVRGDRERMVPFVEPDFVTSIDFEGGLITVDWDPDF